MNCTGPLDEVCDAFGLSAADAAELAEPQLAAEQGVHMLPYLTGERTPDWPHATGCILGLEPGMLGNPGLLCRAAMEGSTYSLAAGIELCAPPPVALLMCVLRSPAVMLQSCVRAVTCVRCHLCSTRGPFAPRAKVARSNRAMLPTTAAPADWRQRVCRATVCGSSAAACKAAPSAALSASAGKTTSRWKTSAATRRHAVFFEPPPTSRTRSHGRPFASSLQARPWSAAWRGSNGPP